MTIDDVNETTDFSALKLNPEYFRIQSAKSIHIVTTKEVTYFEAEGSYTCFHFKTHHKFISSLHFCHYRSFLIFPLFYQIHRDTMIKISEIEEYAFGRGGEVTMKDGAKLHVADKMKEGLLCILKGFPS